MNNVLTVHYAKVFYQDARSQQKLNFFTLDNATAWGFSKGGSSMNTLHGVKVYFRNPEAYRIQL